MLLADTTQIALETEVTNTGAMRLYERLGFLRSKRLHRYCLNGNAAFRFLLYIKESAITGHDFLEDDELRSEEELIRFHGLESTPNVADRREVFLSVRSVVVVEAMVFEYGVELSSLCENHFGAI